MGNNDDTDLTFVAAGDAILTQRLSTVDDDRLDELVGRIQAADASFVNLEVLLHDYEGYPSATSGGTYMRAPPWVADELAWAGFDVLAAANNHVGDYSHGGMEATMRELEEREFSYAGLGRTLAAARSPTYVDTPAGRVAVVAACSTITPGSEAGKQRPDMKGRPGLSPLRLETRYLVPEDEHEHLIELSENLGLEDVKERNDDLGFLVPGEEEDGLTFLNAGSDEIQFGVSEDGEYRVDQTPKETDRKAFLRQIRAADRQADWVVASLHTHEGDGAIHNHESIPAWLESFAHDSIDAGTHAFVSHGPHVLRGVEVYEDAPIFYSLGNFAMQNETVTRLPAEIYEHYDLDPGEALPADLFDARVIDENGERAGFLGNQVFWETVLPICRFNDGGLTRMEFYPVSLGFEHDRPRRGSPRIAHGESGTRILERLMALSEPYGTEFAIEDGVAVVEW